MHERHLLAQVVRLAEEQLAASPRARPIAVRIRVSPWSHLSDQDPETLNAAFALVAAGTRVQGATLEVRPVEVRCTCRACGREAPAEAQGLDCPRCGSVVRPMMDVPDVFLHEIDVEE